jgi:enoyl-CoA hydratase/carnithine racemase
MTHLSPPNYETMRYHVADPVATITLNRPEVLNAFTGEMGVELRHAFGAAERDPSVVGIILTGAGRGFCAGADMNLLTGLSGAYWRPRVEAGEMVIFGPVLDATGSWGLGVIEADDEDELRAFCRRRSGGHHRDRDNRARQDACGLHPATTGALARPT